MEQPICALKTDTLKLLRKNIKENLDRYRGGNFADLLEGQVIELKEVSHDASVFSRMSVDSGGENDARNASVLFQSIHGLTPAQAADQRVWVWLTHTGAKDWAVRRWADIKDDDQCVKAIALHLFWSGDVARSTFRNNAVSSIWWWANVCSNYTKLPLKDTLDIFLYRTDVRATIIERNTSFSDTSFLMAALDVLVKKWNESDQDESNFFKRLPNNQSQYREWAKLINRWGGSKLLATLQPKELSALFDTLASEAERLLPV
jgi:hypothetical protein